MMRLLLLPFITLLAGFLVVHATVAGTSAKLHGKAYPEKLPGTFTGGFGEETCHSCHFDYPLNPGEGSLEVKGIPDSYAADNIYTFVISLHRKELGRAGFQISSRFEDGRQAGSFYIGADSSNLMFTDVNTKVQYLQHSEEGSKTRSQSEHKWTIRWHAPETNGESILFNVAANAGNGDASEFGDFIFAMEKKVAPQ